MTRETEVGKTRLMGAFISYLHLAHGIDNFFVLAPNLTIYQWGWVSVNRVVNGFEYWVIAAQTITSR